MTATRTEVLEEARAVAASVVDPELPMLTLADLGVLRDVALDEGGTVVVEITPTYSGCPAMGAMRADLHAGLAEAGFDDVEVRTVLSPPWTTDWISDDGRRKLAEHGISPPGQAPQHSGPVLLQLSTRPPALRCPQCGSMETTRTSEFGSTACKSLWRCTACSEPFEHIKEI